MVAHTEAAVKERHDALRRTPIYVRNRTVGHVIGTTFHKTIRGSVHLLRRPPAVAFDISTLEDARQAGASQVEVSDSDTGAVYRAPMHLILDKGTRFNRGYGEQVYLTLANWVRPDLGQGEQLALFSEAGS